MYRGLIRDLKAGANPHEILKKARDLEDPYYRSLFLIKMSSDKRIKLEKAVKMAFDSLESSDLEGREWRRGELLAGISKALREWRDDATEKNNSILWEGIIHRLRSIENGEVLSNSIVEISKQMPRVHLPTLLEVSLLKPEGNIKGPKAVIKNWIDRCSTEDTGYPDPRGGFGESETRARLLGYASLQAVKNGKEALAEGYIRQALESLRDSEKGDRIEILRYLIDCSPYPKGLQRINDQLQEMGTPDISSAIYPALGVRCHREGDIDKARNYMELAETSSAEIGDEGVRSRSYRSLSDAVRKLGEGDWAARLINMTTRDIIDHDRNKIDDWADEDKGTKGKEKDRPDKVIRMERTAESGRAVIGLYDTYEGSVKSIHHRMIARAAPLCWAFDFDLALIGFPSEDLNKLIEGTIRETNVGKGGEFLRQLVDKGRIQLVEGSWKEPPKDWSSMGLPVATTSHPDHQKAVGMDVAVNTAAKKHPLKRVCLIMGLGRRGLPNSMLRTAVYHLELTGVNVPLETSTALGVISERLRAVLDSN